MSAFNEHCELCADPLLSDSLSRAEHCRYRGNQDCYAALTSHLDPTSLPSVVESHFMGSSYDRVPCTIGDSVVSTILALCDSVSHLELIVHVIEEGYANPPELAHLTKKSSKGNMCVVLSFSRSDAHGPMSCLFYSTEGNLSVRLSEDLAIKVTLSLQRVTENLVWYWSTELLGYSVVFNASADSMWALSFTPMSVNSGHTDLRPMIPHRRGSRMRVMPFFYCTTESPSIIAMGTGGIDKICRDDLVVELTALSRSVVDRAYCSTTHTGRCFCCQYICSLHSKRHAGEQGVASGSHKIRLAESFWQKVTGDGRSVAQRKGGGDVGTARVP